MNENGLERLKTFYFGYDIVKIIPFTFFNQLPANPAYPAFNDHIYHEKFQLKNGTRFDINLDPGSTPLWRFGFRLSASPTFPPIDTIRHQDKTPYIHLCKGSIYDDDLNKRDEKFDMLRLSIYSGTNEDQSWTLIDNYRNEPLKFSFGRDHKGELYLSFDGGQVSPSYRSFAYPGLNQQFVQITAWADYLKFSINTSITVLQEIG